MLTRTRMGRRRDIFRTLAASIAALALTATVSCGSEPETNIEQADDKSKQSKQKDDEPSPTPTIEEEPYVQVALEYYKVRNDALRTGDAAPMRELSTEDCKTCQRSADSLEDIFDKGGRNKGGQATPDPNIPIEAVVNPSGKGAEVTIVYKYKPQTIVRESGADPERYPAERIRKEFNLKREGAKWLISSLVIDEYKN